MSEYNTIYAEVVQPFLHQLELCTDIHSLEAVFSKTLSHLGFPMFAYNIRRMSASFIMNESTVDPQNFIISNFPNKWLTHYFHQKYKEIDPTLKWVGTGQGIAQWSDLLTSDDIDKNQRRLLQEAWDAGLTNGITLPIMTELGEAVAISVVPEPGTGNNERILAALPIVQILAQGYHRKAKGILLGHSLKVGSARRKSFLSPREIDVLHWMARGKTAWEIAEILSISQKSVDFYTDMAKTKLQAMNRTHAVVKAIMLGLVTLD
ncbi:LuxR family transcriptional regulator [Agrobacterium rhizogenes]|uniref:LuxR family transcriptional regulator n=1 Tax=Rhizobium rhizogenes TaxID=359 RepID=UPI000645BBAF|nr:LuxR family transcriptional regulator [Rhizobium rhizogenes]OCJ23704.1 transcriptional regulator [Agrobacterium sp. B131/95]OCJ30084.1 transcriptional regulator [Agrobacterium sp. B133/95]MDJ1635186.1 LuxR family transcriptional regulator [Rhizobium rhizogenes]NTG10615.1 LuxR family transcriptional regulator [Rhizobium rhizogenes]NTG44129.1 LuxR family transcriptional regulator [Rhizobium rhizogenes]